MSNLTDRELCRRVELACTPQAKPRALAWTDIAVIATLGVAYLVTVPLHGAGLGAL